MRVILCRINYANFAVPYYGTDNDDYVNGQGFCCDDTRRLKAGAIGNGNDNPELFQYYYHSDHLGSSSLITNLDGEVVQHVEYVPFGEVFIEERNNTWNTPYLFNAKELDEETGLYYYWARYYDPRTSIWLSVDPPMMNGEYFGNNPNKLINGGVYNSFNHAVYSYTANNPIKYKDPNGEFFVIDDFIIGAIKGLFTGKNMMKEGIKHADNSIKIWSSFVKSDSEKSTLGRIWQVTSKFTWELPQMLGGVLYGHVGNIVGIEDISFHRGATVIKTSLQPGTGVNASGLTLGSVISVGKEAANSVIKHEYGHYIQSRVFGVLYIPAFGMPSLFRATWLSIRNLWDSTLVDYYNFYTESDANKRADKHYDSPF